MWRGSSGEEGGDECALSHSTPPERRASATHVVGVEDRADAIDLVLRVANVVHWLLRLPPRLPHARSGAAPQVSAVIHVRPIQRLVVARHEGVFDTPDEERAAVAQTPQRGVALVQEEEEEEEHASEHVV